MKNANNPRALIWLFLVIPVMILLPVKLSAQWSNDPTVNTPVCNQAEGQSGSCAVSDGSDGVIAAWLDMRSSQTRIYAQRLNAAGVAQWTAGGVLICSQDGGKQDLVIVGDGSGGAIVAWQDYRNDANYPADPEGDIFAQRIDANGNVQWSLAGVAICTATWNQSFPAMVRDGSGGAIITWMDGRTGNDHVYAQRINGSGSVQWTADGVAICTQGYYQRYPDIASDGSGGAIITWPDQRIFNVWEIYAQRISASGTIQWTTDGVVVCNAGGNQGHPVIIADGSGGAVVAWEDPREYATKGTDIYAQRINANGQPQWNANGVAICTASGDQSTPSIATDGTGGAILTWYDQNFNIFAQRIHGNGNTMWTANGVAICTEGSMQWFPRIIPDDFNGAIISWEDKRSGNWDIYAMRVDGGGSPQWNTNGVAITRPAYDQKFSVVPPVQHGDDHIVKAGTCGAIVVWDDGRANYGDIYAQRVFCNGELSAGGIIVDVPNGGESWNAGSTRYIRWHTNGFSGNVNISISFNGSSPQNWQVISTNETNDGSFQWVVPNNPSSNCYIRISDAADGNPYDLSDAPFTITGGGTETITLDVPNGGENWQIGTLHYIVWHTQNYSGPVRIEYSTDGGASYTVIENSYSGSPSYAWTIPNTPSGQCAVKISDPTDVSPWDISDGVFTISTGGAGTSSIVVDVPNGGEDWQVGTTHYIVWHTQNYTGPVNIEYSDDGGTNYISIESSYTGSPSYQWTIPSTPSANCVVRIAEPSSNDPVDESDAVFTISTPTTNNTPAGQNVLVDLGGSCSAEFQNITQEGNTELVIAPEGPPPPDGYDLFPSASALYYNISTSAVYEDAIEIVLKYNDESLTVEQESQLKLLVYNEDGERWDLITAFLDIENDYIGGLVTHLSTFAIMLEAEAEEPSSYTVTNTQDDGEGSLRKALQDAAAGTGVIMINFNIPESDPGYDADAGVWTIVPQSDLPGISGIYLIIDGVSQSAFIGEDTNPSGPEIQIDGSQAGEMAFGIFISEGKVEILHIVINGFEQAGIYLDHVDFAQIAGCFIGTGPDGWENAGNGRGILAQDHCRNINIVPFDTIPNVISGNVNSGIAFWDTCTNNLVSGNIIGLTSDHTEVVGGVNGPGIELLRSDSNLVGGNWIGGNHDGISIWESSDNLITDNRIGTDSDWTIDIYNIGNGITIGGGSKNNRIDGNYIGNNSLDGVRVNGSTDMYNTISENSISMNESKGINLLNDANGGIDPPLITDVSENEISGTAPALSIIEIFTDEYDEGRIVQGSVVADPEGNFTWIGTLTGPYDSIRATATDTLGNTSEFAQYHPGGIPSGYVVTNTQDSGPGSLRQALSDAFSDTGVVVITFQIPKTDPGFDSDTGVWTIMPQSSYNTMYNKYLIIDGMSQSAFIGEDTNPYGPEIEINGENAGENTNGFILTWSSLELIHVIINRFSSAGVTMWGAPSALIAGCYIGTGPTGSEEAGNYAGIHAYNKCRNIHIVPLDTIPNVISGNKQFGIFLEDTCTNSFISGNSIGLNRSRTSSIGGDQSIGIYFVRMCDSNTVTDNWIGGNETGIAIWESNDNLLAGNKIGTDTTWSVDLMNSSDGIRIGEDSKHNMIMGNFIGNNGRDGIRIMDSMAMYNTISENSISMNGSKGINLLNGANGGIAAPQFTSVSESEIAGTATPMSVIEIFTDGDDEGQIFQGVAMAGSGGNFSWTGSLEGLYDSIRATATDTAGNTSEFGLYRPGGPSGIETPSALAFTLSHNIAGAVNPEINIMFNLPYPTDVNLDVYNLSGVKVYQVHHGKLQAGYHSMTWNTSAYAAGIYFIRMQTPRGALTRKCVLMR
jgi:parallel beta-helix repeat protein